MAKAAPFDMADQGAAETGGPMLDPGTGRTRRIFIRLEVRIEQFDELACYVPGGLRFRVGVLRGGGQKRPDPPRYAARVRQIQSNAKMRSMTALAHDHFRLSPIIGSVRIRFPVAAKMALHTAGAAAGSPGSPKPVGAAVDLTKCTSATGGD